MGWTEFEAKIEILREQLAVDPQAVRLDVLDILRQQGPRPAERLRFLGLFLAASRKLGDFSAAEQAVVEGLEVRTRSPIAQADFHLQLASLRLVQGSSEEAFGAVEHAQGVLEPELRKPLPSSRHAQARRRSLETTLAASLVIYGEIVLHLSTGSLEDAMAHARRALAMTSNLVRASRHTRRVHLSAITLVSVLLVRSDACKEALERSPESPGRSRRDRKAQR